MATKLLLSVSGARCGDLNCRTRRGAAAAWGTLTPADAHVAQRDVTCHVSHMRHVSKHELVNDARLMPQMTDRGVVITEAGRVMCISDSSCRKQREQRQLTE